MSKNKIPSGPCLWVFGDSYVTEANPHYNYTNRSDWVWPTRLAKLLGFKKSAVVSQYGTSNEWIMAQVKGYRHNINPEDVVIIVSSGMGRRWFFKHSPELSNVAGLWTSAFQRKEFWKQDRWEGKGKQIQKALDYYLTYLADENELLDDIYLETFLAWCYQSQQWGQWSNMVLLAGFEGMPLHSGNATEASLFDIDGAEINKDDITCKQKFLDYNKGKDPRIMHLSKPNHEVMAQKLYEHIANKKPLDWTTGFHQNILLDKSTWKNALLTEDEFNFSGNAEKLRYHWRPNLDNNLLGTDNKF